MFYSIPRGSTWILSGLDFNSITKVYFQRGPNYPYTNAFPNSGGTNQLLTSPGGPGSWAIPWPTLNPMTWNNTYTSTLVKLTFYN